MDYAWLGGAAIFAGAVIFVLLPIICVLWAFAVGTFRRYRGTRILQCPETGTRAEVTIDAARAALTSTVGQPCLRVKDCSLWSAGKECAQACLRFRAHALEGVDSLGCQASFYPPSSFAVKSSKINRS